MKSMRRLILASSVAAVVLAAQPAHAGFWSGLTSNFADWTQETAASIARGLRNTFGYAKEDDRNFRNQNGGGGNGGSSSSHDFNGDTGGNKHK